MKTLILNGSPRKNGDTVGLVRLLLNGLQGEHLRIDAYDCGIQPCRDCRYCWRHLGCCIDDGMQPVYHYIQECDNILIAAPIYFSELTGPLLGVASRLQTYFCARFFRQEAPILKSKRGAVLLVGGGDGNLHKPYETACTLLHHMNARDVLPLVSSHDTNHQPAVEDPSARAGVEGIAAFFKQTGSNEVW